MWHGNPTNDYDAADDDDDADADDCKHTQPLFSNYVSRNCEYPTSLILQRLALQLGCAELCCGGWAQNHGVGCWQLLLSVAFIG
eukprot:4541534-Lingulodinium_polyedra.AAC.1